LLPPESGLKDGLAQEASFLTMRTVKYLHQVFAKGLVGKTQLADGGVLCAVSQRWQE
jgi:hypothetical protein